MSLSESPAADVSVPVVLSGMPENNNADLSNPAITTGTLTAFVATTAIGAVSDGAQYVYATQAAALNIMRKITSSNQVMPYILTVSIFAGIGRSMESVGLEGPRSFTLFKGWPEYIAGQKKWWGTYPQTPARHTAEFIGSSLVNLINLGATISIEVATINGLTYMGLPLGMSLPIAFLDSVQALGTHRNYLNNEGRRVLELLMTALKRRIAQAKSWSLEDVTDSSHERRTLLHAAAAKNVDSQSLSWWIVLVVGGGLISVLGAGFTIMACRDCFEDTSFSENALYSWMVAIAAISTGCLELIMDGVPFADQFTPRVKLKKTQDTPISSLSSSTTEITQSDDSSIVMAGNGLLSDEELLLQDSHLSAGKKIVLVGAAVFSVAAMVGAAALGFDGVQELGSQFVEDFNSSITLQITTGVIGGAIMAASNFATEVKSTFESLHGALHSSLSFFSHATPMRLPPSFGSTNAAPEDIEAVGEKASASSSWWRCGRR